MILRQIVIDSNWLLALIVYLLEIFCFNDAFVAQEFLFYEYLFLLKYSFFAFSLWPVLQYFTSVSAEILKNCRNR